ncbi:MAG: hypothetical protein AB1714_21125 [Acidobacteriota bacterium]
MTEGKSPTTTGSFLEGVKLGCAALLFLAGLVLAGGYALTREPESAAWILIGAALIVTWGLGGFMLYYWRRSAARRRELELEETFKRILSLGLSKGGRLYLNDVVVSLDIPLSQAEELMREMTRRHPTMVDTEIEEKGTLAYVFPHAELKE